MKLTKAIGFSCLIFSQLAIAGAVQVETLPDKYIMPCTREIPLKGFTKGVIPIYPMRMVNLTFPFPLEKEKTNYAISSDKIWGFKKVFDGSNIVPIYYKEFDANDLGMVHDLTISTDQHIISLALRHGTEEEHCSNIVFTLSEEEKARLEKERKEAFAAKLQEEYQEKVKQLEESAEDKALLLVAGLAKGDEDYERIKEEGVLELSNGDEVVSYVKEIQNYGKFRTLNFDIENNANSVPVYIKSLKVVREGETKPISGAVELPKKVDADRVAEVVFATREAIPTTGASLILETDQGEIKVSW